MEIASGLVASMRLLGFGLGSPTLPGEADGEEVDHRHREEEQDARGMRSESTRWPSATGDGHRRLQRDLLQSRCAPMRRKECGCTATLEARAPSEPLRSDGGHMARILAFCAANSASVRIPWSLSSARPFNCDTVSTGAATWGGGGGGGGAYCCGCSCWDQRLACRLETRFDTAVAVPAITAVLATPLSSPGMEFPFVQISDRWRRAMRPGRPGVHNRRPPALLHLVGAL